MSADTAADNRDGQGRRKPGEGDLVADDSALIYPKVSIGLLHALGKKTGGFYGNWQSIDGLLDLDEDQRKGALGQKHDRANGYPSYFKIDRYGTALDAIVGCYKDTAGNEDLWTPVRITKEYLDSQDVHIGIVDERYRAVKEAILFKGPDACAHEVKACWDLMKNSIYCCFRYENPKGTRQGVRAAGAASSSAPAASSSVSAASSSASAAPSSAVPAADTSGSSDVRAAAMLDAGGADDEPGHVATPLRRIKDCLFGEDGGDAIVPGCRMSDREFIGGLFLEGYAAYLGCRRHEGGMGGEGGVGTADVEGLLATMDHQTPGDLMCDILDYFTCDEGLHFRNLVRRCADLVPSGDAYRLMEGLEHILIDFGRSSRRQDRVRETMSLLHTYADGDGSRGLAFMLVCSVIGPENDHVMRRVIEQPEAQQGLGKYGERRSGI